MSGTTFYHGDKLEARIAELQEEHCGKRFVGKNFSQFTQTPAIEDAIAKWLENPTEFLVWTGKPGTGKTFFKACMIHWILERSYPWNPFPKFWSYRFWTERDLLEKVRRSMHLEGDYLTALKLLLDDQILFFDDMGSTGISQTDWRKEMIYSTMDIRHETMKPTIVTTNLTKNQVYDIYGARVADRLFAKSHIIIDTHDQESRR